MSHIGSDKNRNAHAFLAESSGALICNEEDAKADTVFDCARFQDNPESRAWISILHG